jgi:hypothetical protein
MTHSHCCSRRHRSLLVFGKVLGNILGIAGCFTFSAFGVARAEPPETAEAEEHEEFETKYIFGFTEGSGVGTRGEWELAPDTIVNSGKRDGQYTDIEEKLKFAYTPSDVVQLEFGPIASAHDIHNVSGLTDINTLTFGGLFGELRYLAVKRGPSPLALTLSLEPEWRAIDMTSGQDAVNYGVAAAINGDVEVLKDRLYLGFNLLYQPERTLAQDGTTDDETTFGGSTAFAYRLLPNVTLGGEAWYLRHYTGLGANTFTGDAVYVGPTAYVQATAKIFFGFAWNAEIAGHGVGEPGTLDLADFSRNRFRIKAGWVF